MAVQCVLFPLGYMEIHFSSAWFYPTYRAVGQNILYQINKFAGLTNHSVNEPPERQDIVSCLN